MNYTTTAPAIFPACSTLPPGSDEHRAVDTEIERRVEERTAELQAPVKEMEALSYSNFISRNQGIQ